MSEGKQEDINDSVVRFAHQTTEGFEIVKNNFKAVDKKIDMYFFVLVILVLISHIIHALNNH